MSRASRWCVLGAQVLMVALLGGADAARAQGTVVSRQKSVAVLSQPTLTSVQRVRAFIEERGGRVRAVIGIHGLIADLEPQTAPALDALPEVDIVSSGRLSPDRYTNLGSRRVVEVWNRMLSGPPAPAPYPGPGPETDASASPGLPRTEDERRATSQAYASHWTQASAALPPELQSLGCHRNGAGYYDTSLYLAGDIAVGVFYRAGSSGGWTPASANFHFANVVYSLDQFIDHQPNGRIAFSYVSEVDGVGLPLPVPGTSTAKRTYVNDLRNTWCTDWAFMVTLQNGGVWPNADLHGPETRIDSNWGWFDYVVRHETGHIFGAMDQYANNGFGNPTLLYGYLGVVNANRCGTNGQGYFSGGGECQEDLMNGWPYNSFIGAFSAGQLGWHDTNSDGLLDVASTFPDVVPTSIAATASTPVTYSGTAIDRPLLTELGFPYGSVSINSITRVEYRLNGLTWTEAAVADGIFDSNSEGFLFTLPALPNSPASTPYTVEFRATNTVGNVERSIHKVPLVITGSTVTNARPFAALSVTPQRAQAGTLITADASASRDLETPASQLEYRFKWAPSTSFTPYSTSPAMSLTYSTPGTYTVQVEVRDANLNTHVLARTFIVELNDTAPVARFTTGSDNRHDQPATYSVLLNANAVSDAETAATGLEVDWDLGNFVWENNWEYAKTEVVTFTNANHPKSERRRLRVRVRSSSSSPVSEATRFLWLVPYNHRPTLPLVNGATFTLAPSGTHWEMTVHASDLDYTPPPTPPTAPWDNFLEYRYDYDNDGTYDTDFSATQPFLIPFANRYTVTAEVRDRFHARVRWTQPQSAPVDPR